MIGAMLNGDPDPEDVRRYYRALRRAQRDIDVRPERYTHYYKNEFPEHFHAAWTRGAGDPASASSSRTYSKGSMSLLCLDRRARDLRARPTLGSGRYEDAVVSLEADPATPAARA